MTKRILFLLAGVIISVVSLYFAFRDFDLGKVGEAMGRVRVEFFLLMLGPYVLTFMAKVWRWRVLFHPDEKQAPFGMLFGALMISYIPLPFRAGEVARGAVVSTRTGIPAPRVFSTIVIEKVLDVLTLLLLLGISLPFVGLPSSLQGSALLLGAGVLGITLVLLALILRPDMAKKVVGVVADRMPARLGPRIAVATDQALQGLAPLRNVPIAARLGAWSLVTWGANSVVVYLMMLAFNVEVTPLVAAVLVVATNLSMVVPSAPGYVGPFEAAVVGVLTLLGVELQSARLFALIYHFVGLVPVAAMGVVAAIQQGVGMSAFRAKQPERKEEVGTDVRPASASKPTPKPAPSSTRDTPC